MGGEEQVPTAKVGDAWEVPERAEVTTPTGETYVVTGGLVVLTSTGTWSNDTGDRITVRPTDDTHEADR